MTQGYSTPDELQRYLTVVDKDPEAAEALADGRRPLYRDPHPTGTDTDDDD